MLDPLDDPPGQRDVAVQMPRPMPDHGIKIAARPRARRQIARDADHAVAMRHPRSLAVADQRPAIGAIAGPRRIGIAPRQHRYPVPSLPVILRRWIGDDPRLRLLLGGIAPLHDVIVLHAVHALAVPPARGGQLADIVDMDRRVTGREPDDDPPIPRQRHHQQLVGRDLAPILRRRIPRVRSLGRRRGGRRDRHGRGLWSRLRRGRRHRLGLDEREKREKAGEHDRQCWHERPPSRNHPDACTPPPPRLGEPPVQASKMRSGGRVVEGARLESEYTAKPYRGFESLPLRQFLVAKQECSLLQGAKPLASAPFCSGRPDLRDRQVAAPRSLAAPRLFSPEPCLERFGRKSL